MSDSKREILWRHRVVLYALMFCQLIAWAWFMSNGGELSDSNFLIFTAGMLLGQIGATIETFLLKSFGTMSVQIWFFGWTLWGGLVRLGWVAQ